MNFMPKPKDQLISEIKNSTIPKGVYHAKVIKDEDITSDESQYLKLWLKLLNQQGIEFYKTITLSHNEKGFFKVYRYCMATGRDYNSGQLKKLTNDEFYIEFDVYKDSWIARDGTKQTGEKNAVRDFFSMAEGVLIMSSQSTMENESYDNDNYEPVSHKSDSSW